MKFIKFSDAIRLIPEDLAVMVFWREPISVYIELLTCILWIFSFLWTWWWTLSDGGMKIVKVKRMMWLFVQLFTYLAFFAITYVIYRCSITDWHRTDKQCFFNSRQLIKQRKSCFSAKTLSQYHPDIVSADMRLQGC